jgi:hypothetical protein
MSWNITPGPLYSYIVAISLEQSWICKSFFLFCSENVCHTRTETQTRCMWLFIDEMHIVIKSAIILGRKTLVSYFRSRALFFLVGRIDLHGFGSTTLPHLLSSIFQ